MDDIPWQIAKGRKRKHRKRNFHLEKQFTCSSSNQLPNENGDHYNNAYYENCLQKVTSEICQSPIISIVHNKVLRDLVFQSCEKGPLDVIRLADIICYGLGSPTTNRAALYQLGLLVILKQLVSDIVVIDVNNCTSFDFNFNHEKTFIKNVTLSNIMLCDIYDPVFNAADCQLLQALGFTVLQENENAQRLATARVTIFYMIHCTSKMYEDLLKTNWNKNNLNSIIIIGNSLTSMYETLQLQNPNTNLKTKTPCLHSCYTHKMNSEIEISDWKERPTVFNDTVVTYFTLNRLSKICPG